MTVIQPLGWQQARYLNRLVQGTAPCKAMQCLTMPKCWNPGLGLPYWLNAYTPSVLAGYLPKGFYVAQTHSTTQEPLAAVVLQRDASGLQRDYLTTLFWQESTQGLQALVNLFAFLTNRQSPAGISSALLVWVPREHHETLEPLLQASGFCKIGKQTQVTLYPNDLKQKGLLQNQPENALPNGWESAQWLHRSQLDALAWEALPVPFRPWLFPVPEGFYLSPWKRWSSQQAGWFIKRWVHHSSNGLDASFEWRTQDFSLFNLQVLVSPYYPSLASETLLGALQQSLKMAHTPTVNLTVLSPHPALEQALTEGLGCTLEAAEESHLWVFGSRTVNAPSNEQGGSVLKALEYAKGYATAPIRGGATSI
jgi:hypothetical protein